LNLKSYLADGVSSFPVLHQVSSDPSDNISPNSHIERELMLSLKICVRQRPIQLRIRPRNGEPNPSQHIVRRNPIHMVLINLRPDYNSIIILLIFPPPLTSPLLPYRLGPAHRVLIWRDLLMRHIRMYRLRIPSIETQGASPYAWWYRCRRESPTAIYGIVPVAGTSSSASFGHLKRMSMFQLCRPGI
jgi:hypothetical protein